MEYRNITNLNLDALMGFLARKVDCAGTLVVCQNDKVLNHVSTPDIKIDSLIVKGPLADTYTIYIRSDNKKPERIICHEFIHLMQEMRGDLVIDEKTPLFTWKGEVYEPSFPYRWRPWEKEAFNRQNFWYKEYRKATNV